MSKLLNNIRAIFGIGDPTPPPTPAVTPPKPKVDTDAVQVGGDLITVCRNAVGEGLTLKGGLDGRRDAIKATIVAKKYDQAQTELNTLKADIQKQRDDKTAWTAKAADVLAVEGLIGKLTGFQAAETGTVTAELQAIKLLPAAEDFKPAADRLEALKQRATVLDTTYTQKQQQKAQEFAAEYTPVKTRCEAVLAIGDDIPAAEKAERIAFATKHADAVAKSDTEKLKAEVLPALDALEKFKTEHDAAKDTFTKAYAALQTKIAAVSVADATLAGALLLKQQQFDTAHNVIKAKQAEFDFKAANDLLADFTTKLDDLHKDRAAKTKYTTDHDAVKAKIVELRAPGDDKLFEALKTERAQFVTAYTGLDALTNAGNFEGANLELAKLTPKVDPLLQKIKDQLKAETDYGVELGKLKKKVALITGLNDDCPTALKGEKTAVVDKNAAVLDKATKKEYAAALALLKDELTPLLGPLETKIKDFNISRSAYKKQKAMLDGWIAKSKAVPNTGTTATARTEFDAALLKVETEEGKKDYVKAMTELKDLNKKIGALTAAKHKTLLDDATTPAKAKDAINGIPEDELGSLSQTDQIKLLKQLRTGGQIHTASKRDLLMAQGKLYKKITLNPEFREKDVKVRNELLDTLDDLPDYKEAKTKWNEATPEATALRQKFMTDVLTKHCALLGVAAPPITFTNEPEDPVDGKSYGAFGPGPPDTMKINLHPDVLDFKEQLITIVHENTHNYQTSMIRNKATITDPELKNQIEVFDINNTDPDGYISPSSATALGDFGLYDRQPLEEHAEEFGQYVTQKLMAG